MKRYLILILCVFSFLCRSQSTSIKDITWVLIKIEDKKNQTDLTLNHDHSVLLFEDSTYAGYGCDAYTGRYKINGDKISFIGGMQITDAGCSNPNDYTAEDYVMKNFTQLKYRLATDSLFLNKDNEVIFTFIKRKKSSKIKKVKKKK